MYDISVIIPTNRTDHWLDLAIESVLTQSTPQIEVIVVLDGLKAPTNAWATLPNVVVVERAVSGGPSIAMQEGIDVARGRYIARLDSDDIALPERLEKQKEYLDLNTDFAAVSALIERIDEQGLITGKVDLPHGEDIRKGLLLYNFVPHSTLMFRKEVCTKVGGYNPVLRQMEDYDFILRLSAVGKIAQLGEVLVQYRVHSGQTSRGAKATGEHIETVIKSRNALAKTLRQPWFITKYKNIIWRTVQFTRNIGITKPRHMQ